MEIVSRLKLILQKKALHQTIFVYTGSMVNGLSLFALNIVLAKIFNQELFGIFSLSVLVLMTVAELSDFGLNMGLLRFGPYYIATDQPDKLKQLLKTIWRWRVSLSIILTVAGLVLAYPLARYLLGQVKLTPYLAFASLGIGGIILLGFLATYLQTKQRFFYHASLQSLKGFLRLVIVLILLFFGVKNLFAYLSVYILVPWVLFIANFKVFPEKFREVTVDASIKNKLHSQLARFSFWLTVSSFMSIFVSRIDQVMVSRLLGLVEVAIFTVAWQLIQFFPIVYSSITSVLMPKISSLTKKEDLVIFVKRSFKWVLVVVAGLGIIIYPSQYLIQFLFGDKYIASMPVYLILAYGYLLTVLAVPFSLVINVFNKTHWVAISGVAQILINLAANMVFIPMYGIMGAAYAFAMATIFTFLWNVALAIYFLTRKEFAVEI
ncbi:MAG: oligosaccharide flippase family protein [Candidatus Magasanikbacteria bacterium]|nr:oligosaccharide flippase family protein [Candidatus Magasanikbacteria bacterium]